jgi:hypothetical protein
MQFERSHHHFLPMHGIPQDSFIANTSLSFCLEARNPLKSRLNDDLKKGSWQERFVLPDRLMFFPMSKSNGRWTVGNHAVEPEPSNRCNETVSSIMRAASKAQQKELTKKTCFPLHELLRDIGKRKPFTHPEKNTKNNAAAVQIQRITRGGWQRLKFRIALLQNKLDAREQRTAAAIANVRERLQQRKEKYLKRMKARAKAEKEKVAFQSANVAEANQVIGFLQEDNTMIRTQNEELYQASNELKLENERIECSNQHLLAHCSQLEDHVKTLKDTNDRLLDVIPQYKESIDYLQNAIELHQVYSLSEYLLKVNYIKYTGTITQEVDNRCEDDKLVDEIAGYCLAIGRD